jgi:hypothetical protein
MLSFAEGTLWHYNQLIVCNKGFYPTILRNIYFSVGYKNLSSSAKSLKFTAGVTSGVRKFSGIVIAI